MSGTMPVPRAARPSRRRRDRERSRARRPSSASGTRPTTGSSSRVVALIAIGILMVYSSSAMKAYLPRR